jgi:2-oxoglutarate dehydrogenase E2 component (dihydrolipoamide succinyltransferase)
MATKVVVPELGESVLEATVGKWLKKEGDWVNPGDVLVTLETDKVDLEVGAERGGVLARIERQTGEDVKIGEELAIIEEVAPALAEGQEAKGTGLEAKVPEVREQKAALPAPPQAGTPPSEEKAVPPGKTQPAASEPPIPFRPTPAARRYAREHGLGAWPGGTMPSPSGPSLQTPSSATSSLVEMPRGRGEAEGSVAAVSAPREAPREERIRMSRRRLTIARRLVEAQRTAAMLTTFNEVDMTAVMELRARHKESFKQKYGVGLGIVSFFVKACIGALREFPRLNAEIDGEEMVLKYYYDIGVAIGAPEGLVVPVLRDADRMSLAEIELAVKEFVRKSEEGKLSLDDLRGGTFTISNGGVYGSLMSTPILNPPQVGILGLHKIQERPVTVGGQMVSRPMMYVALSYDHRIVDGSEAVRFLVRVKELVEDPASLLFAT